MTVRLARIERADGPKAAPLPKKAKAPLEAKAPATARVKVEPIPRGEELDLDDFAVFVARLARACGGHGPAVMAAGRIASRVVALRRAGGDRAVSRRVMGAAVALVREIWRDPLAPRGSTIKSLTLPLMEDAPTHPGELPDGWRRRLLACLFEDFPGAKKAPRDATAADGGAEVPPHAHAAAPAPPPPVPPRRRSPAREAMERLADACGAPRESLRGYGYFAVYAETVQHIAAAEASLAVGLALRNLPGQILGVTVRPEEKF